MVCRVFASRRRLMLRCRDITISSTEGFAASVSNMPGAKPNCLRIPSRMLCVPAGTSSRLGAVNRDMGGTSREKVMDDFVHSRSEHGKKWVVKPTPWLELWHADR